MPYLETDPLDLAFGADNHLQLDGDGLHFISGLSGVAQLIRIAILLFLGEWFLNLDAGMPWHQEILGQKFDAALIRQRLTERISKVPAVAAIVSVSVSFDSEARAVAVDYEVRTDWGDTLTGTVSKPIGGTSV